MKLFEEQVLRCLEDECGQVFQITHTKQGNVEVCPFCQGDIDYVTADIEDSFIIAKYNNRR